MVGPFGITRKNVENNLDTAKIGGIMEGWIFRPSFFIGELMKYFIPIDRNTIKYNDGVHQMCMGPPERRRTIEQIYDSINDKWIDVSYQETISQPTQTVYSFPGTLYDYVPTLVKCDYCDKEFLHTELKTDYLDVYDNYLDDFSTYCEHFRICPFCNQSDCCELEYEKLTEVKNDFTRID